MAPLLLPLFLLTLLVAPLQAVFREARYTETPAGHTVTGQKVQGVVNSNIHCAAQ